VIQTSMVLKLEGGTLRTGLRAAAAAAASASCFAARRAALLFVRGRIVGAAMLLGRGLGLVVAAAAVVVVVVVTFSEVTVEDVTVEDLAVALVGRIAATEEARLTGYSEGVAFITEAWDAGRCRGSRGGLKESFEFVRESAGVLGATGARTEADGLFRYEQWLELSEYLHMNDVGGPCSLVTRKAALLFDLGANVGAFALATAIDSRRLCPGTPSKRLVVPFLEFSWFVNALFLITGIGGACPSLRDAARVIRGAIIGGAVDATAMVLIRLCPGTLAKVSARRSLVTGPRGALSTA
jgi:hypothetical protein